MLEIYFPPSRRKHGPFNSEVKKTLRILAGLICVGCKEFFKYWKIWKLTLSQIEATGRILSASTILLNDPVELTLPGWILGFESVTKPSLFSVQADRCNTFLCFSPFLHSLSGISLKCRHFMILWSEYSYAEKGVKSELYSCNWTIQDYRIQYLQIQTHIWKHIWL